MKRIHGDEKREKRKTTKELENNNIRSWKRLGMMQNKLQKTRLCKGGATVLKVGETKIRGPIGAEYRDAEGVEGGRE